jgi:hypothetical protein
MSLFEQPFVDPSVSRFGDEIDVRLRQFFQAEMPDPWPKLTLPQEPSAALVPARWRGWTLLRSRLALAASVGLLVGGHVLLSNSFRGDDRTRATSAKDPVVAGKPDRSGSHPARPVPSTVPPGP